MPFTILRRLDCILEPTKDEVLAEHKKARSQKIDPAVVLKSKLKLPFFNTSQWTFAKLVSDPEGVADNLVVRLPIAPCAAARCHTTVATLAHVCSFAHHARSPSFDPTVS